jgi:hypothetical protein
MPNLPWLDLGVILAGMPGMPKLTDIMGQVSMEQGRVDDEAQDFKSLGSQIDRAARGIASRLGGSGGGEVRTRMGGSQSRCVTFLRPPHSPSPPPPSVRCMHVLGVVCRGTMVDRSPESIVPAPKSV